MRREMDGDIEECTAAHIGARHMDNPFEMNKK
jgi:hypothetical protein